jgi:dienelactone hydrolase
MRRATPLVAAIVVAGCGDATVAPAPQPSGPSIRTSAGVARPYGVGASQVWVLTPRARQPRSVVVFVHGWAATTPFEWHQAWLDHLLKEGSAVIFPVYQPGSTDDPQVVTIFDLRTGLRRGFAALGKRELPVVAAGFSFGATLAFYYAANARYWGLPPARAVYSIFPVDPIAFDPGLMRLHRLPAQQATRVELLVGDRDAVVGDAGARAFWEWLSPSTHRLSKYRVVRTTARLLADHEAPTYVQSAEVRRVFWRPLDALISRCRASGEVPCA